MKSFAPVNEKEFETSGFFIFGGLSLFMAILKLAVFGGWSWWRVLLPLAIFGGFNIAYLLTSFIYLSFAEVWERSSEDNASLLEHHDRIPSYWVSLLFFALFADNLLRFWGARTGLGLFPGSLKLWRYLAFSASSTCSCTGQELSAPLMSQSRQEQITWPIRIRPSPSLRGKVTSFLTTSPVT